MGLFEVIGDVSKDLASEVINKAERYTSKAENSLDKLADKISAKVEYYSEKENARNKLKKMEEEYEAAAIELAEALADSKVNSPKFCLIQELKIFRAMKEEYEQAVEAYDADFGDYDECCAYKDFEDDETYEE